MDEGCIVHIDHIKIGRFNATSLPTQLLCLCILSNRKHIDSHYRHYDVLLSITDILTHYF
jgi:hypothetical protein